MEFDLLATCHLQDAEDSGVLNVSAASNSLNLVLRDEGLMKFVKVGALDLYRC
jgi:hypothetical protein